MSKFVDPPGFAEWEATLPAMFTRDTRWRMPAYRFGVWMSHLVKQDFEVLYAVRASRNTAEQLLRSVESISSNLAEGYARSTGRERARYYDMAAATAHEARDWYFKARDVLGDAVVEQRLMVLDRIIRILTVVIPRERERKGYRRGADVDG